jgi:hypothetical protein
VGALEALLGGGAHRADVVGVELTRRLLRLGVLVVDPSPTG